MRAEIHETAGTARRIVHVSHRHERHTNDEAQPLSFRLDEGLHEHIGRKIVGREPGRPHHERGGEAQERQRVPDMWAVSVGLYWAATRPDGMSERVRACAAEESRHAVDYTFAADILGPPRIQTE